MIGRLPLYGDDSRESLRALFPPRDPVKTAAILHFNRRRVAPRALLTIFTRTALKMHLILQLQRIYYEASRHKFRFCSTPALFRNFEYRIKYMPSMFFPKAHYTLLAYLFA